MSVWHYIGVNKRIENMGFVAFVFLKSYKFECGHFFYSTCMQGFPCFMIWHLSTHKTFTKPICWTFYSSGKYQEKVSPSHYAALKIMWPYNLSKKICISLVVRKMLLYNHVLEMTNSVHWKCRLHFNSN